MLDFPPNTRSARVLNNANRLATRCLLQFHSDMLQCHPIVEWKAENEFTSRTAICVVVAAKSKILFVPLKAFAVGFCVIRGKLVGVFYFKLYRRPSPSNYWVSISGHSRFYNASFEYHFVIFAINNFYEKISSDLSNDWSCILKTPLHVSLNCLQELHK